MNIIPRKFAFPQYTLSASFTGNPANSNSIKKTDSTFVLSQNQLEIQNDRIVLVNDKILLV